MAYTMRRSAALLLDTKGFDSLVQRLDKTNRKPALKEAIVEGASIVQKNIRSIYKSAKPSSNLDQAIVMHVYPSAEGVVVRRFYIKGGMGKNYDSSSPIYRSYILNFWERGTKKRYTKGRGSRYARQSIYRGALPAIKFFQKGISGSKRMAFREIERILLKNLEKIANK
jgi:hypothetical protein